MEVHSFMNILDNAMYTILNLLCIPPHFFDESYSTRINHGLLGNNYCIWKDVLKCLIERSEKLQIPYTDICQRCLIL